jgi:hypothetical protein
MKRIPKIPKFPNWPHEKKKDFLWNIFCILNFQKRTHVSVYKIKKLKIKIVSKFSFCFVFCIGSVSKLWWFYKHCNFVKTKVVLMIFSPKVTIEKRIIIWIEHFHGLLRRISIKICMVPINFPLSLIINGRSPNIILASFYSYFWP